LFEQCFTLPSIQGISGNIDITANEIHLDDKIISDFDYKNSIKNGIFGQSKLLMKIYDGEFEYKGLCDIKYNKIINGLFSCKSCNLKKILNDFYNVSSIDGVANLSGNIVSIAKSVDEFKDKIDSDINLAISSPKVSGYGLKDLVTKMFSVKEFANELAEPEKILENKESSTQFLQGKGFLRLRGEKNSNFSISLSGPAINSIFSGIIFLKDESINGTLNTIFLSGSSEKKVPINIATNVVGFFDDVGYVSNLNQARQYLGLERINNQELNTKLLAQSEEKKIAKKNKINKKSLVKKKKEGSDIEEEVTVENQIIEETQIIEVNKPADIKNEVGQQTTTIIKNEDVTNINEVAKNISDTSTTTTTSTNTSNAKTEINENNSVKKENIIQENKATESQDSKVVQPSF
jgi:NDP-sugar pyrophosphorylase family protein